MSDYQIEDHNGREPGLGDLIAGLWANALFILLVTFVLGAAGYVYAAFFVTPKYESSAVVIFPKDSVSSLLSTFGVVGGEGGNNDKTSSLPMLGVAPARQPTMDYAAAVLESRSSSEQVAKALNLEQKWGMTMPQVLKKLGANFVCQRVVRENKMVLSFRDKDRELTTQVLNAYLKTYDLYTQEHSLTTATRQRKFVEGQLAASEKELEESRRELVRFETGQGAEVIEAQPDAAGRIFSDLLKQQVEADGKFREASSMASALREKKIEHAGSLLADAGAPPPKDDPMVADLQSQLQASQINLDNLRLTRTEQHPDVVAAQEQCSKLRGMLDERVQSLQSAYTDSLSEDLIEANAKEAAARAFKESADQMVDQFTERARSLPAPAMSHNLLKRRFSLAETMNRALHVELQRAMITESLDSVALEVLDPPQASEKPVYPKKGTMAITAAMLGFILACGWVLVRRLRTEPTR